MRLDQSEILSVAKGISNGINVGYFENFSIDSRKVKPGGLFFAIRGAHVDGHDFVDDAVKHGARGCIVERDTLRKDIFVYKVESVKNALINLGGLARKKFSGKVVGITGSAGKTTTKELVYTVLSRFYPVSKTEGNANTEYSLPLFFLNGLNLESNYAVTEMGVQKVGDMDLLNKIVMPDIAILLNASQSHLEFLGSVENVAKEKFKLASFVDEKNGIVILNGDDENFYRLAQEKCKKCITFGFKRHNVVNAKIEQINTERMTLNIFVNNEEYPFKTTLSGVHYAYDILSVVAMSYALHLPIKEILNTIENFAPLSGRGKEIHLSGNRILLDETYNANPLSLEYSLSRFRNRNKKLFLILGDMLELGSKADAIHKKSGKVVASFKPDYLVTYGDLSRYISEEVKRITRQENVHHFKDKEQLLNFLRRFDIPKNVIIFVKGSRGLRMEDVLQLLIERYGR